MPLRFKCNLFFAWEKAAKASAKAKAASKKGAKANAALKRPAAAAEEAVGKAAAPAHKRPAAAAEEVVGKANTIKPNISDIKCRSCVTARTGLPGLGMTRSIRYEDDPTAAREEAAEWLRTRCEELGVQWDY